MNIKTNNKNNQLEILDSKNIQYNFGLIILNKEKFIQVLEVIESLNQLSDIKRKGTELKNIIEFPKNDSINILNIDNDGDTISLRRDVLISEIEQILESQTIERANYYVKRLKNSVFKIRTNKVNDMNLLRWKEYDNIITDSLWVLDKRDTSGAHLGWYWGNFIPQIPHQMMLRYTKKCDWVLDTFVGSGVKFNII